MANRKPYRILSCKFNGSGSAWARSYARRFCGLGNYEDDRNKQLYRQWDVREALGTVAVAHLGYEPLVNVRQRLSEGVDVVVDYFTRDWWRGDKDAEFVMDKSKKKRGLYWFEAFAEGLLLTLLSERWDELTRICNWVEADLVAEDAYEIQEKELPDVYKCVASSFRGEPMPGLDRVERRLKKCPSKRPKLLYEAWAAARDRDQSRFDKALLDSLRHFRKNFRGGANPVEWIAQHHSVVALTARRLGMSLPELTPEQDAVLIRPETIG